MLPHSRPRAQRRQHTSTNARVCVAVLSCVWLQRLVAALDFAIKGAGKFNVDSAMLITELYQLGKNRTGTKEPLLL